MLDGRISTLRASKLYKKWIYKRRDMKTWGELMEKVQAFKQRTGQHQLLLDFQLLFPFIFDLK